MKLGDHTMLASGFWINTPHLLYGQEVDRAEVNIQESHESNLMKMDHHDWATTHHHVPQSYTVPGGDDLFSEFHTYALEWTTDNTLKWYYDGTLVRTQTSAVLNTYEWLIPAEVLLSAYVNCAAPPGSPDPGILGNTYMEVDYVHVSQKPGWDGGTSGRARCGPAAPWQG